MVENKKYNDMYEGEVMSILLPDVPGLEGRLLKHDMIACIRASVSRCGRRSKKKFRVNYDKANSIVYVMREE